MCRTRTVVAIGLPLLVAGIFVLKTFATTSGTDSVDFAIFSGLFAATSPLWLPNRRCCCVFRRRSTTVPE